MLKNIRLPRARLWLVLIVAITTVFLTTTDSPQQNVHKVETIKANDLYLCNGQEMTAEKIAEYRGITFDMALLLRNKRSLTPDAICIMPQAKLERAISKATAPATSGPDEAAKQRMLQLQDENGNIPADGLVSAQAEIDAMAAQVTGQAAGITSGGWTELGPGNIGGRVRSIVIHPTNTDIMWAGSVTGGIWKTTDGGASWQVMDDFMTNMSVTSLVIDPTDPDTLYAGTGEASFYGTNLEEYIWGTGVFKTTNGGTTWTQLGATSSWYSVSRLAISPNGTLLAATWDGAFRSINGGDNWAQTLTFATWGDMYDINFAPGNNLNAIASGYDDTLGYYTTWYSTNGGQNWTESFIGDGGRIEVAYAPSAPSTIYASINQNSGEIWKSTDGGANFTLVSTGYEYLGGQGDYDNIIWVNPEDANMVIVGGIDLWRSTDGGVNLTQISQWWSAPDSAHADHHYIIEHPNFDNSTNKTAFFGNDGGVYKADDVSTVEGTSGWTELNNGLGITQFYAAAGNPTTGKIVGGTQDNGTLL